MGYYKDIREYIQVLERNGKLVRIKRDINKDTELMPLVRWQFRGLDNKDRKAFLFENPSDVNGNKYDTPVLVAAHAASEEVYALAMACKPQDIRKKWEQARLHPIEPRMVESGPVQEEIHAGENLLEHAGLGEFAVPISTPGFDNAPYISAGCCISRDPENGTRNVGTYRCMVKSPTRLGLHAQMPQHIRKHWEKYKQKGSPMPVALVIGATPNIGLVSVTQVPYGVDEYDIAGGIAGEPVELVKCRTIDLEVPAMAEIVLEGEIPTDYMEREGPFGEHTGYIGMGERAALFVNVTCITHRKKPIWTVYISQFPPSESSVLRSVGDEASYYKLLKYDLGIDNVVDVAFHNESGSAQFCVISMKKRTTPQVWQALYGATAHRADLAKMLIAVDDDIDPRDMDSVIWALCYRMQPHRDIQILPGKTASLDLSAIPPVERSEGFEQPPTSSILIDATRKWDYPPTALPKKEFMEKAKQIWEEEGLPPLKPKVPWYGLSWGYWPKEVEEEALLALKGEHYKTGDKLAQNRISI